MKQPSTISSRHNPHFKRWLSLLDTRGIKHHHQCLVSGNKIRMEIQNNPETPVLEIVLPPLWSLKKGFPYQAMPYELSPPLFRELDVFGTKEPLFVCKVPGIPNMNLTQPPSGLEILCPIGDPGNLGALLRCCRAFDVRTVILLREAVHPFHPKVIRASSGAVFVQSLNWGDSITDLNRPDILKWITALDVQGSNMSMMHWSKNARLLIGEEGVGIPEFRFGERVCIPQNHSSIPLNSAVAGSIALYAYRQFFSR